MQKDIHIIVYDPICITAEKTASLAIAGRTNPNLSFSPDPQASTFGTSLHISLAHSTKQAS